METAETNEGL